MTKHHHRVQQVTHHVTVHDWEIWFMVPSAIGTVLALIGVGS